MPSSDAARRPGSLAGWPRSGRRGLHTRSAGTRIKRRRPHSGPYERSTNPTMAFKDILARFKKGLAKTAQLFNVRSWFGRKVDQDFLDELEGKLIQADVGVKATGQIV